MKKYFSKTFQKIFMILLILGVGVLVLLPNTTFAAETIIERVAQTGINNFVAGLANIALTFTSSLVSISGSFLSVSINLTTHIKDLYLAVPAIQTVWITIRDISSILIIFFLLYVSIRTILGLGGSSVNQLIVKIFLAGIFINFSLFFVRVAVDASNLVSLQFYNAIAPNTSQNATVAQAFTSGGLSNVFMQSLKIPTIYKNASVLKGTDVFMGITVATLGGVIIMVIATMSFLAAAIAFTARTGIILFVMALSPIYFVGLIFPEIKRSVSDKIFNYFKSQLIFMPVYLFLMYIALKILNDPKFMSIFTPITSGAADPNGFGPVWIGVFIQYTIAILFINAPLVAAISLGGIGMKWAPNAMDISKRVGGFFGRNFVGRPSGWVGGKFDDMAAAAQGNKVGRGISTVLRATKVSQAVRGTLDKGEKGKYGGPGNLESYRKEDKDRSKLVAGVARKSAQQEKIRSVMGGRGMFSIYQQAYPTEEELKKFRGTVAGMDVKEMQEMDMAELTNSDFITSVPSGKFDSLIKEMSPSDQQKLKDARKNAFIGMIDPSKPNGAEFLVSTVLNNKAPEIAKLPGDVLKNPEIAKRLDAATLRKMLDENVDGGIRDEVRNIIEAHYKSFAPGTVPKNLQKTIDYFKSPAGGIF